MKNNIIFISIVSLLISSCEPEYQNQANFIIKNFSTQNIELTVFNVGLPNYTTVEEVTFLFSQNAETSFLYVDSSNLPFNGVADSAYITFNDNFRIIYRRGDLQPRNILDINSYSGGKVSGGWQYEYTITNEDYNNAEPIE